MSCASLQKRQIVKEQRIAGFSVFTILCFDEKIYINIGTNSAIDWTTSLISGSILSVAIILDYH